MKTGSPNDNKGLPEWPKFQGQSGMVLNLSNQGGTASDFAVRHNCGPLEQAGLVAWEWK